MKKSIYIKLFVVIIMSIVLITLVVFFINSYNRKTNENLLLEKGYTKSQINEFYNLSFDIKTVLKYDNCNKIDEILNKEFNKNNLDNYLNQCILEINTKNELIQNLQQQKYYIPDNLERYIAYSDNEKSLKDVVTEVNCNIDNEFYTNIKSTDLSKKNLILVNKYYSLDETYEPINPIVLTTNKYTYWSGAVLDKDAYDAFVKLVDDAKELGYYLIDTSAFRTYEYQSYLFNKYLNDRGLEETLKSSAKPGHSEHQTGLSTDIVKTGVSMYDFGNTKEFTWLKENAHKYGFILRYPKGKEYLTGYKYEPWHYRYVGVDVATYIYENDIVFEEYYAYFCEYKNEC